MEQLSEFAGNHLILFSLLVAILIALGLNIWTGVNAAGKQVTPQAVIQLINHEAAAVLDVRDREAFEKGHILESIHIPMGSLEENRAKLEKYKEAALVICCQTGNLAAQASRVLAQSGHENLYRLQGGISAWQSDNLPLTRE